MLPDFGVIDNVGGGSSGGVRTIVQLMMSIEPLYTLAKILNEEDSFLVTLGLMHSQTCGVCGDWFES